VLFGCLDSCPRGWRWSPLLTDREARWWRRLAAANAVGLVLLGPLDHQAYLFTLIAGVLYGSASGVLHFLAAVPVPRRRRPTDEGRTEG